MFQTEASPKRFIHQIYRAADWKQGDESVLC